MPVNKKGEDKMENAKVSNKKLMSLAILFVSALEMGGMGLQPALADIAAAFPDIPTVWMQEMSNWPGFAMLLGCALSTLLATKVSKKALCQIGVGFVVAYAILGFTLHSSFIQLMMWQTILGLGFGFLMPTSNGIIAENYTPVAGLIKPNDTSFRFLFAACVCTALALLVALAVSITKKKRVA